MTPTNFIKKWQAADLKECSASQAHFLDHCGLLDIEDPISSDPRGDWFTFERGASKTSGGEGWGDDWRSGKLTDDEILARLFRLNQERAAKQEKAK